MSYSRSTHVTYEASPRSSSGSVASQSSAGSYSSYGSRATSAMSYSGSSSGAYTKTYRVPEGSGSISSVTRGQVTVINHKAQRADAAEPRASDARSYDYRQTSRSSNSSSSSSRW